MKRKDIIDLPVYLDSGDTYTGVIKEIMLSKEEFKVEFFLITDNKSDSTFMVPFSDVEFDTKSVFVLNKENMVRMGNFYFNNESKYHEVLFCGKDVLANRNECVGTVIDYVFEDKTGALTEVFYFDYNSEKTKSITVDLINENKIGYISFATKNSASKDAFFGNPSDKSAGENKKEVNVNIPEREDDFEKELIDIISRFKIKIERDHDKLRNSYVIIEKEIVKELDDFTGNLRNKLRNFFDYELKQQEEDFRIRVAKNFDDAVEELIDFSKYNNKAANLETDIGLEANQNQDLEEDDFYQEEKNNTINLDNAKKQIKNPNKIKGISNKEKIDSFANIEKNINFDDDLYDRLFKPKVKEEKLKEIAEPLVADDGYNFEDDFDDFYEESIKAIRPSKPEKKESRKFTFRRIEHKKNSDIKDIKPDIPSFEMLKGRNSSVKPPTQGADPKFIREAAEKSQTGNNKRQPMENINFESPKLEINRDYLSAEKLDEKDSTPNLKIINNDLQSDAFDYDAVMKRYKEKFGNDKKLENNKDDKLADADENKEFEIDFKLIDEQIEMEEKIFGEELSNENFLNEDISNENISNEDISNENIPNENILDENLSDMYFSMDEAAEIEGSADSSRISSDSKIKLSEGMAHNVIDESHSNGKLSEEKRMEIDKLFGEKDNYGKDKDYQIFSGEDKNYHDVLKRLYKLQSKKEQVINQIGKP